MCQQALQGFHPAPPAFFRCLHDTHLETAHVLIDLVPVDPVPAIFSVGGRTGERARKDRRSASQYTLPRHLPCLLSGFARLSRDEKPRGSQPAFTWSDFAHVLYPYPTRYRPAFACSAIPYPQPYRLALRLAFPRWESYGLTAFHTCTLMG